MAAIIVRNMQVIGASTEREQILNTLYEFYGYDLRFYLSLIAELIAKQIKFLTVLDFFMTRSNFFRFT